VQKKKRFLRPAFVLLLLLAMCVGAAVLARSSSGRVVVDEGDAPPQATTTAASWNPDVNRLAVVTSVERILGDRVGSCGGATETGGGFLNHLIGTEGESQGQPIPAEVDPNIAFVEIDGLKLTGTNRKPWADGTDGDATTNAIDPGRPDIANPYMKTIHLELSRRWGTIRMADGSIRGPFLHPYREQTVWPVPGTLVDVQGFVRWDAGHTGEQGHACSGWEIHPVSAWRLHASH